VARSINDLDKQQQNLLTEDMLAERIRESMVGLQKLRDDNGQLTERVRQLEAETALLQNENQHLRRELDRERAERRHYHSLANEVITRLDVVQSTIEDVVKRAQHEVYRQREEHPTQELPRINVPEFLRQVQGGNGEEKKE